MNTVNELKEWAEGAEMISVQGDPCFVYVNWEEVEDEDPLVLSLTPAKRGYDDIDFYEDSTIEIKGHIATVNKVTLIRMIQG